MTPNIKREILRAMSIVSGFFQLFQPRDRPRITGKKGKVHGVKIVSTPAQRAIRTLNMSNSMLRDLSDSSSTVRH